MSSDYIPRLRSELLRAGASRQARFGWARTARRLRPLAVGAAVALVVATIVLALPGDRHDETPVDPSAGRVQVNYFFKRGESERAGKILRARLDAAGVRHADVSASRSRVVVTVPEPLRAEVTALVENGRFAIYDWERSVLGPDGTRAPADEAVTGGADAGHASAITRAEARSRAAAGPGARVVQALKTAPDGWFALAGAPALTNADVAAARPGVDPTTKEPIVTLEFTAAGAKAFTTLTRTLAHRGADSAMSGTDDLARRQHLAIVIDDRLVSIPWIDFRVSPDGIDGATGAQISGGLTTETARRLAAILSAGPISPPTGP